MLAAVEIHTPDVGENHLIVVYDSGLAVHALGFANNSIALSSSPRPR
jgi:hypothetical protein